MVAVPVLYLDIVGTVIEGPDDALGRFVNTPEDVRVFPEALKQMERWNAKGGRIVGVTNQGGVAMGFLSKVTAMDILNEVHKQTNGLFTQIRMCPHHPDAKDPLQKVCWCRKPRAGMIIEGASDLAKAFPGDYHPAHLALMVGDMEEDKLAADAANILFLDAKQWRAEVAFMS